MGTLEYQNRKHSIERLAIRWEGLWIDNNFRDIGESMNQCIGSGAIFAPNIILRSNVWFSGWSCNSVGNPVSIYSLNRSKVRKEVYFCRTDKNTNVVGRYFQDDDFVLNDLEFLSTWEDPKAVTIACAYFRETFKAIADGQRILVHCDAGKDRTGTYAALVTALTAERLGILNENMLDAIECDYRKSKTLEKDKYNRMRAFISEIITQGGVEQFFKTQCKIESDVLHSVADRFGSESHVVR